MGRSIVVNGVQIGEGKPKICVPLTSQNSQELKEDLNEICKETFDLIEWRMDFFTEQLNEDARKAGLLLIKEYFPNKPLLVTYRTVKEGGKGGFEEREYFKRYESMVKTGLVDIIDIEMNLGEQFVRSLIDMAHRHHTFVILSHHNFYHTPPKDELISILKYGQQLGGDIVKLAVMPEKMYDVLVLLEATLEMTEKYGEKPIVTMAMGNLGLISRIVGEWFGSSITFGSRKEASAPGQLPIKQLQQILDILHEHRDKSL